MLLKDILPQGNAVPETIYEAKEIIYPLGLEVEKFHTWKMIAFYIVELSTKTPRKTRFVDSTDSIIEKRAVMTRTAIEIEEKADPKRCFDTFLSFLI
jgi:hypothetical protein